MHSRAHELLPSATIAADIARIYLWGWAPAIVETHDARARLGLKARSE
jgi:hypothetical protein